MKTNNSLGIWMDHANAHLIDLNSKENSHTITSKFTSEVEDETIRKSEKEMHNKRQHLEGAFYKEIANVILKYDNILLFGPTDAKKELHNFLNKDSHFKDIHFDISPADKMTENEMNAFVKKHFKM